MSHKYEYINLEATNDTTTTKHLVAIGKVENILHDTERYIVGIDRFTAHNAQLPVFQETETLTVRIVKKSDSSNHDTVVDFTGLVDSNGFMYTVDFFINAVNSALATSASTAIPLYVSSKAPFLTLDRSTGRATLDYSGETNFGDDYYVEFSQGLYNHFPHFQYASIVENQDWYRIYTPNTGTFEVETADEIRTSPVDKLYIQTSHIPVIPEMFPRNTGSTSTNTENVLTDFEYAGSNRFSNNIIGYTATSGQYRFHSMEHKGKFSTADLSFHFKTYKNQYYAMKTLPGGAISAKLIFRRDM